MRRASDKERANSKRNRESRAQAVLRFFLERKGFPSRGKRGDDAGKKFLPTRVPLRVRLGSGVVNAPRRPASRRPRRSLGEWRRREGKGGSGLGCVGYVSPCRSGSRGGWRRAARPTTRAALGLGVSRPGKRVEEAAS